MPVRYTQFKKYFLYNYGNFDRLTRGINLFSYLIEGKYGVFLRYAQKRLIYKFLSTHYKYGYKKHTMEAHSFPMP